MNTTLFCKLKQPSLALATGYIVSEGLKLVFRQPRPFGAGIAGYSFPSTHTTVAFAMAVVLAKQFPALKYLWYVGAVLIAASRVFYGYHFPIDLLAGGILGLSIGLFINHNS